MATDPYRLTGTQARDKIRSGELSVEKYARSLLGRVSDRDGQVKAWAFFDPDLVLEQARRLDRLPPEARGPLHGLAVGVKDIFYTKDMPTQHNSRIYENDAPKVDSGAVTLLRQAGALIMGKTTTTEFAVTMEGPPTRNPHDLTRTPGGSSSGSGAAVADYEVPLAIGTQTGGSIIRPGSFNGVYAFKPTWNAVSREGQKITSVILDTLGWFARSVADLQLLADVFKLEDDEPPNADFSVKGAKFAVLRPASIWPLAGPGTRDAMAKAVGLLENHGANVEEISFPDDLDKTLLGWHRDIMIDDGRSAFQPEYALAKEKITPGLAKLIEKPLISRKDKLRAFDGVAAARPRVDELLAPFTAVLVPSVPDEAPEGMDTGSAVFNGIWTALHVPVVNVPGFKGPGNLPVGVSLVAPRYHDRHLLTVSEKVGGIFEEHGGWKSSL